MCFARLPLCRFAVLPSPPAETAGRSRRLKGPRARTALAEVAHQMDSHLFEHSNMVSVGQLVLKPAA